MSGRGTGGHDDVEVAKTSRFGDEKREECPERYSKLHRLRLLHRSRKVSPSRMRCCVWPGQCWAATPLHLFNVREIGTKDFA